MKKAVKRSCETRQSTAAIMAGLVLTIHVVTP
jgi:hypothetical protein